MGNLAEHAKKELDRVGLFDKNSDYEGMLGQSALALIEKFASQGHSGLSAELTIDLFHRLAQYKPLTALTCDPDEWADISTYSPSSPGVLQNKRQSSMFSTDGGKSWYDVTAKDHTAITHCACKTCLSDRNKEN